MALALHTLHWGFPLALLLMLCPSFYNVAPLPPSPSPTAPSKQQNWTWCVDSAEDLALCEEMIKIIVSIDPDTHHTHSCVRGPKRDDSCMEMIHDGQAMFSVFDGGEIWKAHNLYNLVPIRTQHNDVDGSSRYFGVGVVKAGWCPSSLFELKGKRSCHTGYNRASGWILPITYLLNNNIMPLITTDASKMHDIQSVEAFFTKSCAASDEESKEICTACKTTSDCNEDDLYYDYTGAFRCLVEGNGDVTFTKGDIPTMYAKNGIYGANGWTNLETSAHYKLLCPNSSCADVDQYMSCNFGSAPGHTIMVSNGLDASSVADFHTIMDAAITNAAYVKLFSSTNYSNSEFGSGVSHSLAYNGSVEELLGSLYQSIIGLQNFNSIRTSSSSSRSFMPSTFSILLLMFLLVSNFLSMYHIVYFL